MRKLAGKFTLLDRADNEVTVGFVGDITADSLTYEDLRYIAAFYTDGKFVIKAANILASDVKLAKPRTPQNNCNSIIRICVTKLDFNTPESEYQALLTQEADKGVEIKKFYFISSAAYYKDGENNPDTCDVRVGLTPEWESDFYDNEQGSYFAVESYETREEMENALASCSKANKFTLEFTEDISAEDRAYLAEFGLSETKAAAV